MGVWTCGRIPAAAFAFVILTVPVHAAPVTYTWWNEAWTHRVKVSVKAIQDERDFPVDVRLNLSNYFQQGEAFDPSSVRVVEQDAATGAVIAECPAIFVPTDFNRRSLVPASRLAAWLSTPPQKVKATSEVAEYPAKNVIDDWALFGGTVWKASEQQAPWIISVDLGSLQSANCVMVRYPGHGGTPGVPVDATIEVSADSPDGLTQGTWEKVGEWKNSASGRLYNVARVAWFAPRKVRFARLVITKSANGPPELEDFQVRLVRYDPKTRSEGTVNWIAPGGSTANKERVFFVYFDRVGGAEKSPAPTMMKVGIFREAEDSPAFIAPTGWSYAYATIEGASGLKNPNSLSVAVHPQKYLYWDNAGFPVTLPQAGSYTLTLRVRCDPGEHEFEVLVDNQSLRKGKVSFGDGWTMAQVADLPLTAGVHYLEVFLMNGKERPLDFDCLWLTNYADLQTKAFIAATVGQGEVKP